MSPILFALLKTNINYLSFLENELDIIDLQCCNYNHLTNQVSSNFQSSMIIVHCIYVGMHNMPKVDELRVDWNGSSYRVIS